MMMQREDRARARPRLLWAVLLAVCLGTWAGCGAEPEGAASETAAEQPDTSRAGRLIAQAVAAHGMERLDRAVVEFDFRGVHFTARHDAGGFRYARAYTDSAGAHVREVLSSDSLYRSVAGERQDLPEDTLEAIEGAVNAVVYLALLPYKLDDPAAQARYLGRDTLRGTPYHQVEITFRQEGGGRDWQDRFVYWLHPTRRTMDYLAYYFHTDGGGARFREAVNARTVNGVRVQDYLNYAAAAPDTVGIGAIDRYGDLLEAGALDTVSVVRTEDVQVFSIE